MAEKMAKIAGKHRLVEKVALVATLTACGAAPTGVIPVPEEGGVVVRVVGSAPVEPEGGVVKCAVAWDGVSVCWMVTDSVRVAP